MINLLNKLKDKVRPFILEFFDAPIEETEASRQFKKAKKVISAAQKLTANVGYCSTLKFDVLKTTGKHEYESSAHIYDSWVYDQRAIDALSNIYDALQEYNSEQLTKAYKKFRK